VIVAAFDEATEELCRQHGIPYHSDADLRYTFDVVATGGQPLHDPTAKVTMEGKAFQQIGALKVGPSGQAENTQNIRRAVFKMCWRTF